MKPYGLEPNDLSHRPNCRCCTTKYHGNHGNTRASETKDAARRAGVKRGRQNASKACKEID